MQRRVENIVNRRVQEELRRILGEERRSKGNK